MSAAGVASEVASELSARGARDEALGVWRERRTFGITRTPELVPAGRAWRLGALLLDADGRLYAIGRVTRAVEPKDFNSDKTVAGEERRDLQRAAVKGGFRHGDTVNIEMTPLDTEGAQELLGDVPLEAYLRDRADLLPEG